MLEPSLASVLELSPMLELSLSPMLELSLLSMLELSPMLELSLLSTGPSPDPEATDFVFASAAAPCAPSIESDVFASTLVDPFDGSTLFGCGCGGAASIERGVGCWSGARTA